MADSWTDLESREVFAGRVFRVREKRSRSGRTGEVHDFQVLEAPDWINVVPVTPEGQVVLIRQFRHGVEAFTLEVPGGMVDPGESPADAAARELREETGYAARGGIEELGMIHPNPAIQGNRCFSFLARSAVKDHDVAFDPTEDIEVVLEPLERIPDLVREGRITHALVVGAFHWLHLRGFGPVDRRLG